ncbi:MAG: bifunctional DNA-binding transcriptional regulator/O6-methylguanine-DNA methyltransferase Ada [Candidatus Lustribacter sp.]|jgi:AraC family transcriptional regulator of adaptative response/methylated-DNA-[protein]-cysteine methyltransferase
MNSSSYFGALNRRDPAFDGVFVYAVTTTGVYCRPSCKSRRPLERNVRFFADLAAARAAGFRACKRCRPDDGDGAATPAWLAQACRLLEEAEEAPTLDELASSIGISRAHLQRTFTRAVGVSPHRFAATLRERRLRTALRSGATVTAATYESGFGSSSRVYESAAATIGMTPARYRQGAMGMRVTYGIVASALGPVLVAATDRGIAHVALGDDEAGLEAGLRASFPKAVLERADDRVESATSALVRYLSNAGPWPQLPLDVRATAFQARVWEALTRIAPGTTTTYGELARALGDPRATRAVARACATNPVAVLIPCHRVIAKSGDARGYRWGLDRKKRLLEIECSLS